MNFLECNNFYLVGIKGVAMTSLAQLLLDAGKTVAGSDVPEEFITQAMLERVGLSSIESFEAPLPASTECLVYTAAHQGSQHPQVQQALQRRIPTYSHAEALSFFLNQKQGIAVCGVGGKSTVSAMITWILEKTGNQPSYSVGVGNIIGLNKTGQWREQSTHFVAEADEYAANPFEIQRGEQLIPRFAYLKPYITVCTHLAFDHPDIYKNEAHTTETFNTFFSHIQPSGKLIINEADRGKVTVTEPSILSFGTVPEATLSYKFLPEESREGVTVGTVTFNGEQHRVTLHVPGEYNLENAAAAILASVEAGVAIDQAISALSSFQSTSRRFEKLGSWNEAELYDDYAHHPSEITAVLKALTHWYPTKRCLVAFQPHTYSRTKSLFLEFASALSAVPDLVLLDIFASARESDDPSISSQLLAEEITKHTQNGVLVLKDYQQLAEYCTENLRPGDVFLTLGAGDIYKVHELLKQGSQ